MRYAPGQNAEFDEQMRAIVRLTPEARLAWLEERRRVMWELASERTRERWMRQWLESPHHITLADLARVDHRP
jgi:hypothetical protein